MATTQNRARRLARFSFIGAIAQEFMNEKERHVLYREAIKRWGVPAQMDMLIEECSELIDVICKHRRGRVDDTDLSSEIADVQICSEQIALLLYDGHGYDLVDASKTFKLNRLKERLKKASEQQPKEIGHDPATVLQQPD